MAKKLVTALLPDFVFAQSSQWLPGKPGVLEEGTDFVLAQHPQVVALTEIFSPARSKRLQEAGYTVHHQVGTDPAVLWDDTVWRPLYQETLQVTDLHYWTKEGKPTKPQQAVFVVLEHLVTGHRLLVVATHYPPRTEGSGGPGGIWRPAMVRRWSVTISALSGIRKIRRKLRKEFKYDAEIITGDWNLDIMRTAVRAWFQTQFPSMPPNFGPDYKGPGTLGKRGRVVDFSLLRNLIVIDQPKVFKIASSDHSTATTWLRFENQPKNHEPTVEEPPVVVPPVVPPVQPQPTEHECPKCFVKHVGVVVE